MAHMPSKAERKRRVKRNLGRMTQAERDKMGPGSTKHYKKPKPKPSPSPSPKPKPKPPAGVDRKKLTAVEKRKILAELGYE